MEIDETTMDKAGIRDGFRFRGGALALDLTATLQARLSPAPRELLADAADLDRWLTAAGLAPDPAQAKAAEVALARRLREAIYVLASAPGAPDPAALAALNRIAAGVPAVPVLDDHGAMRLIGPASALLTSLARDAIALLGSDRARRIHQCQSQSCAILFVDTSRSGDRRWCSMAACGNKAKVRAFRDRKT